MNHPVWLKIRKKNNWSYFKGNFELSHLASQSCKGLMDLECKCIKPAVQLISYKVESKVPTSD